MRLKVAAIAIVFATGLAAGLVGCEDEDVGVPCPSDIPAGATTDNVLINAQALSCRSRLCIRYGGHNAGAKAVCTEPCDSADDCPDSTPGTCAEGYSCVVGHTEGELQCCKMCVCNSDLPTAEDPLVRSCEGKTRKCPSI